MTNDLGFIFEFNRERVDGHGRRPSNKSGCSVFRDRLQRADFLAKPQDVKPEPQKVTVR